MADQDYAYTKSPIAVDRLELEIRKSAIVTALRHATLLGTNQLTVTMADVLSSGDQAILDAVVSAHTGAPLILVVPPTVVSVATLPDSAPFAAPSFRTKWDAAPDIVVVQPNTPDFIDMVLSQEKYLYGGELIIENAELGDWISAEICDMGNVIPGPYQTLLAENWPTVAQYIVKRFIRPMTPTSTVAIDTRPLSAKVTAGLYLRVNYHPTATGVARRVVVNYFGAKKL